jgi:chromosomal replication initiation ATPase DnaA
MDNQYIDKLKEWIELDNQVIRLKEQLTDINEDKKELEEEILKYVEDNSFDKLTINISDGSLKFSQTTQKSPISIKFLKSTLNKYNEEHNKSVDIDNLLKFISSSIETKTKRYIKRDVR